MTIIENTPQRLHLKGAFTLHRAFGCVLLLPSLIMVFQGFYSEPTLGADANDLRGSRLLGPIMCAFSLTMLLAPRRVEILIDHDRGTLHMLRVGLLRRVERCLPLRDIRDIRRSTRPFSARDAMIDRRGKAHVLPTLPLAGELGRQRLLELMRHHILAARAETRR